jgi:hypothetical protein
MTVSVSCFPASLSVPSWTGTAVALVWGADMVDGVSQPHPGGRDGHEQLDDLGMIGGVGEGVAGMQYLGGVSGSGRFLGGYRHTALDRDDAMVLGVGEFGAEEQVVRRQVQV